VVPRDHRQDPRAFRRRQIVTIGFVVLSAVVLGLSLRIEPGSTSFYWSTIALAGVWTVGAVASGPLHLGRITRGERMARPVLTPLVLGFGTKMGLVPLHVWMPPTYVAAPFPAAAVLSGAAVKAGVIGLVRFLPFGAALPGWGEALAVVGFVSAFFGVAVGLTQRNPGVGVDELRNRRTLFHELAFDRQHFLNDARRERGGDDC
jgi:hypothetical protein